MKTTLHKMFLCAIVLLCTITQSTYAQFADAKKIVQQYLTTKANDKLDQQTIESINVTRDYVDVTTGIRHIYANQQVNGLTLNESVYGLHLTSSQMFDANNLIPLSKVSILPLSVNITANTAVQTVFSAINYTEPRAVNVKQTAIGTEQKMIFSRNDSKIWDIPVRLVYFENIKTRTLTPTWEVQMMDVYKKFYWQAFVDANTGVLLQKRDLITHCDFGSPAETDQDLDNPTATRNYAASATTQTNETWHAPMVSENTATSPTAILASQYRVIDQPAESPQDTDGPNGQGAHAIKTTPATVIASPDGWHRVANATTYQYTRGNNVWAFQDPSPGPLGGVPSADPSRTAYNNGGLMGAPVALEPYLFDYPINLTNQPETYRNAAIVNLFYWNNLVHDVYYNFGFDEVGGNFENSHVFSSGLKGTATDNSGDDVLAQAQDGGGTNNANFLTQADGVGGQMQMYLWTGSLPDSIVKIDMSSTGTPPNLKRFFAIQGSFAGPAQTDLFTAPVLNKPFIIVEKNMLSTMGSSSEGCTAAQMSVALPPNNNVVGKIVLIDRGSCSFVEKVLGAQNGGAAGVIVINNTPGEPIAMGGADAPGNAITIPSVMVAQNVGAQLKAVLLGGGTITGSLQRKFAVVAKRDGDLDNGVIAHEYGHGISSRLTGGPDGGALSGGEQGGEGWSDFTALYMTLRTNDLTAATALHPNGVLPLRSIGNYVTYQVQTGRGIRPRPYSIDMGINELTFQNINDGGEISVPHGVGSIWCTMLYEVLQEMIDKYGFKNDMYQAANPIPSAGVNGMVDTTTSGGNNVAMRLIIEGMKIQPSSPTFVQMRDAILKADTLLYGGRNICELWRAFAKRGLGLSAVSGTNAVNDEMEAYNVPLICKPDQRALRITKTGPTIIQNGNTVSYTITVSNKYATTATGVTLRDTLPTTMTLVSANPAPTTVNGNNLEWAFNIAGNSTQTFTVNVSVTTPTASTKTFSEDNEGATTFFTPTTTGMAGQGPWVRTTNAANANSGTKYWYSENIDLGGQESFLTTTNPIAIPVGANLVFIHKFATEAAYDGGVVEVSTDNGVTWVYLPGAKFSAGAYNGIIPTANNPNIGAANLAAFSGASPGYITSIASLDNYANMNLKIRFRMVSDATGGSVDGWYIDDVLILSNVVTATNKATVRGIDGEPIYETEGTNAFARTSAFVIQTTVLPVGLGNLFASLNNGEVSLKWSNQNDQAAKKYIVERKGTSDADFVAIGSVDARALQGNQAYNFIDKDLITSNQFTYRIKVENSNASILYTNAASIKLNNKDFNVTVYPNPAKNVANINIKNANGGTVTYKIFDVMGKRIGTFNAGKGTSINIAMPVNTLSAGTYFVEIYNGENTAITQMVVTK